MKNRELVVLLPAYNEEKDVKQLIETWLKGRKKIKEQHGLELKIVVINDGSTDRTEEIVEQMKEQFPCITLLNHEGNKGLGAAVRTGLSYVVTDCPDCEATCLMDCDNTQDPKYVLSMLRKMGISDEENEKNFDVVIASRYQKGSKVQGVAGYRLLTSQGARFVYSLLLGVKGVRDYTCGYRLYSREILKKAFEKYGDGFVSENGFTCMAEVLYKLYKTGARFAEVPFTLRYDHKGGASKMKVLKTATDSITLALRLRKIR